MSVLIGAELNAFAAQNLEAAIADDELVTIDGGTFMMGSGPGGVDEKQVHEATISTFQMCKDDVTNEKYEQYLESLGDTRFALIGAHPDTGVERVLAIGSNKQEVRSAADTMPVSQFFPGAGDILMVGGMSTLRDVEIGDHRSAADFDHPRQPVVFVSWYEAFIYAFLHGGMLPTEWQWEYAARVIHEAKKPHGVALGHIYQGKELREYATASSNLRWNEANYSTSRTSIVGSYPRLPNGLSDMCGNACQWMQNWFGPYPVVAVTDPPGLRTGKKKCMRGGSFNDDRLSFLRAAHRLNYGLPDKRRCYIGFRWVVRNRPYFTAFPSAGISPCPPLRRNPDKTAGRRSDALP